MSYSDYMKEYRKKNPEFVKSSQQRSYDKIRVDCFNHYGGIICKCCGEKELKFLHLDHINGDGAEKRRIWQKEQNKIVFGGTAFYYWLRKNNYPDLGLQVLCANCNLGKRTNKYCPHELKKGIDMNGKIIIQLKRGELRKKPIGYLSMTKGAIRLREQRANQKLL